MALRVGLGERLPSLADIVAAALWLSLLGVVALPRVLSGECLLESSRPRHYRLGSSGAAGCAIVQSLPCGAGAAKHGLALALAARAMAAPAPLGDVTASLDAATNAMASETTEAAAAAVLKPQPSTEDAARAAAAAPAPSPPAEAPADAPPEATPDWWPPVEAAAPAPAPAVPDPFTTVCMQPAFDADGVECDTAACEDLDIMPHCWAVEWAFADTKRTASSSSACVRRRFIRCLGQAAVAVLRRGGGRGRDQWAERAASTSTKRVGPARRARGDARRVEGFGGVQNSVLRTEARGRCSTGARRGRGRRVTSEGRKFGVSMKKDKERGVDGKYLLSCVRLEVEARAEACRRAVERQRALELGEEVPDEEEDAPPLAFCRLWELYEELNEKKRKLAEEDGEDDESSDV